MDDDDDGTVQQREAMVERQIASRGIRDPRVLDAMRHVPRHAFVAAAFRREAYDDTPLPIEAGQTISQPYIVALMLEAAHLGASDRLLEIGAGSGYASAVAARLVGHVDAIERHPLLAELARERLARLGCTNVAVHAGDGSAGWPAGAPYDAIVVAAAGPRVPQALREQLAIGGRLVMPVEGGDGAQRLLLVSRRADDAWHEDDLGGVMFVPLVGAQGWPEHGPR
ncbi:MAG TPA: protein-L-isoaspartate(D-aspartate) O-methyltransferase [Caldimonas sp.]|jgi:protein-L-isoaspartate(D-aspartate) O-methyltransferase